MQYLEHEGVEWLELDLLSHFPRLRHGFFLRKGGISHPPFHSLNLALDVGDLPDAVLHNRKKVEKAVSYRTKMENVDFFFGKGTHRDAVEMVQKEQWLNACGADGIYTQQIGQALFLQHADCQIALFYDKKTHSGAVVHAGWRGQVQQIYQKTVKKLQAVFGVDPTNLFVGIGPSLGPCCFEFRSFQEHLPQEFWPFQVEPNYFDFWAIAKDQLYQAGIPLAQIQVAEICTKTDPRFFSYRRQPLTGRQAAYLILL